MRAEFGDRARFHFFRLRGGVLARRGGEGGEGAVASTRDRCFVFESRDVSMPLECIYVYTFWFRSCGRNVFFTKILNSSNVAQVCFLDEVTQIC